MSLKNGSEMASTVLTITNAVLHTSRNMLRLNLPEKGWYCRTTNSESGHRPAAQLSTAA
uniref:Uncharacterized protein n=1 Tax=Triticum urartu TaxID=4572 RepID=A0A8R7V0H6_TRIUA